MNTPTATGPFGFPLTDKQAFLLETIIKDLPKDSAYAYRKAVVKKAITETLPGERSDVSWITTESRDLASEIVTARGMNDAQYRLNPIVTMNHAYWAPPVGKSLWRKYAKDGEIRGIKAKTQYPRSPETWPEKEPWPPDIAFSLVSEGLLNGKSIGFLPTKIRAPTNEEKNVSLVIEEWLLLEYACVYLPAQPDALVDRVIPEEICKALEIKTKEKKEPENPIEEIQIIKAPFTTLSELEKAVARGVSGIPLEKMIQKALQNQIEAMTGKV